MDSTNLGSSTSFIIPKYNPENGYHIDSIVQAQDDRLKIDQYNFAKKSDGWYLVSEGKTTLKCNEVTDKELGELFEIEGNKPKPFASALLETNNDLNNITASNKMPI